MRIYSQDTAGLQRQSQCQPVLPALVRRIEASTAFTHHPLLNISSAMFELLRAITRDQQASCWQQSAQSCQFALSTANFLHKCNFQPGPNRQALTQDIADIFVIVHIMCKSLFWRMSSRIAPAVFAFKQSDSCLLPVQSWADCSLEANQLCNLTPEKLSSHSARLVLIPITCMSSP